MRTFNKIIESSVEPTDLNSIWLKDDKFYAYLDSGWESIGDRLKDGTSLEDLDKTLEELTKKVNNKVDKVEGKALSTNDFTDELKSKLDSIDKVWEEVTPENFSQIQIGDKCYNTSLEGYVRIVSKGDNILSGFSEESHESSVLNFLDERPTISSAFFRKDSDGVTCSSYMDQLDIVTAGDVYNLTFTTGQIQKIITSTPKVLNFFPGSRLQLGWQNGDSLLRTNGQLILSTAFSDAGGTSLFLDMVDTGSDSIDPEILVKIGQTHEGKFNFKTLGQLAFKNETSKNYREVTAENIQQIKVGDTIGGIYTWDSADHEVTPWIVVAAGWDLNDHIPYSVTALSIGSEEYCLAVHQWNLDDTGTLLDDSQIGTISYIPSLSYVNRVSKDLLVQLWIKAGEWYDPMATGNGIFHLTSYNDGAFYYGTETDLTEVYEDEVINTVSLKKRIIGYNAESLYEDCTQLKYSPVVYTGTSTPINCRNMYRNCKKLRRVNFRNPASNAVLDADKYDILPSDVRGMFSGCSSLTRIEDIIDMRHITDTEDMFKECSNLESVRLWRLNADIDLSYTKIDGEVLSNIINKSAADHVITIQIKPSLYNSLVSDDDPAGILGILNSKKITLAK